MARYVCEVCEYAYDESRQETAWEELSDEWECPVCGSGKELYHPEGRTPDPGGKPAAQRKAEQEAKKTEAEKNALKSEKPEIKPEKKTEAKEPEDKEPHQDTPSGDSPEEKKNVDESPGKEDSDSKEGSSS